MAKKILALVCAVCMCAAAFTGCGGKDEKSSDSAKETKATTAAKEESSAAEGSDESEKDEETDDSSEISESSEAEEDPETDDDGGVIGSFESDGLSFDVPKDWIAYSGEPTDTDGTCCAFIIPDKDEPEVSCIIFQPIYLHAIQDNFDMKDYKLPDKKTLTNELIRLYSLKEENVTVSDAKETTVGGQKAVYFDYSYTHEDTEGEGLPQRIYFTEGGAPYYIELLSDSKEHFETSCKDFESIKDSVKFPDEKTVKNVVEEMIEREKAEAEE